ncbi:MAG: glycosyltransferase family 4 protein, partial [Bacteroidales bacterium]|nr:glycosyltransferase family 4 protein [Bacteroidales bacterium]
MRILQFCNKSPFPAKEGGPIAMHAMTNMLLQQGHSVKIIAVNTPKYTVDEQTIDPDYREKTGIELVNVNTNFRLTDALKSLLTNKSYHVERFRSKELEQQLIHILQKEDFDLVIFETIYLAIYADIVRKHSKAKLVLRTHNIEHFIWKRVSDNLPLGIKKLYLSILSKQLELFEIKSIPKFDAVMCISFVDKQWVENRKLSVPIKVIPFGIDMDEKIKEKVAFSMRNIFYIGSMDWFPNLEGVCWFLKNVWKFLHEKYPELIFRIAGRNIPEALKAIDTNGIEIVGEVENAQQFMEENGILVVPLWSGSGVRIKIIEAMSVGKLVITTSIGVEGIEADNKKHVLTANTVNEFVETIDFCMKNPALCKEIAS